MMTPTRRRFLTIAAGAAAATISPGASSRAATRWSGVSLGAPATMVIDGLERPAADAAIQATRAEIERLERLFSLYRPNSALVRLNRDGHLDWPDADFLELLSLAHAVWSASGGAFDPTVQPLWKSLAFDGAANPDRAFAEARETLGFEHVRFSPERISFDRPGMAMTLNGIAQGFITDRVAALLRARGLQHVLIDIGEIVAIGGRADKAAWPVAIRQLRGPPRIVRRTTLADRALATSEPLATTLDRSRTLSHILDPKDPASRPCRSLVSVAADRAATADGVSTALSLLGDRAVSQVLKIFPDCSIVHMT